MKDNKLKFTILALWWLIFFVALMIIATVFFPITLKSSFLLIVKMILFCAFLAIVAEVIFFVFVFPKMDKQRVAAEAINKELSQNGLSEQLINYITEQYNFCETNMKTYYMYHIGYAVTLAACYCDLKDWNNAYRYINSVNLEMFKQGFRYVSCRRNIVLYYATKMIVYCEAGDRGNAENLYPIAKDFFDKYGEETQLGNIIEMCLCEYEIVCGRTQDMINKIEPILNSDDSRIIFRLEVLAKAYAKLGNREKAVEYWEKLLDKSKGDFTKKVICREIEREKQQS